VKLEAGERIIEVTSRIKEFKYIAYGGSTCKTELGETVASNKTTTTTPGSAENCSKECDNDSNCKGW
jgi:hypothetical protein